MNTTPFQALACPLDGKPLTPSDSAWCCSAGHSFDMAKQGYVNLLPVQQKRSSDPGDSKAMVAARRRFLEAGHYQPIAEAVSRAVFDHAEQGLPRDTFSCLDAGCGDGYYLRELANAGSSETPLALMGLDISKWAVQAAAKQDTKQAPQSCWVVGSNANLPVQSRVLDCVLCMFGFPVFHEFARALKPGGLLIQVEAGADHLRELRDIIYPTLKPERTSDVEPPAGFASLGSETLRYTLTLNDAEAIADLLVMTPHFYRATTEGREKAAALGEITMTVDVRVVRWERI
ncbi:methyltransferase domain-containing protein [Halomonas sp. SH5A2]|uniref:putative RNA methyltransferase n=1 Tax=Halomonas sp. SH5A2 TaxID=2749040 RepID=UPI00163FB40E|nr:methyltransferase domain-containing protein [Halomonas sp. SH5A2]QNI03801.1 methyltransferase domain-containing protein [Halomonas sp. SH5A2]